MHLHRQEASLLGESAPIYRLWGRLVKNVNSFQFEIPAFTEDDSWHETVKSRILARSAGGRVRHFIIIMDS